MFLDNALVFYDHGEVEECTLVDWSDIHHFIHAAELDIGTIELPNGTHVLVYDRNAQFDKYAMVNHSANMYCTIHFRLGDIIYGTALIVQSEALLNLNA